MPIQDIKSTKVMFGAYLQKLSATVGLNSQPTSVDLDLIVGSTGVVEDVTAGATGFMLNAVVPGSISGLTWGSFKFMGVVQSWTENFSQAGRTYSVKMVDPRVLFKDIVLILDGTGPVNGTLPNLLNAVKYYGTPGSADRNKFGMSFTKIRDFLATASGAINIYNKPFKLSFSSGFTDPSGIPSWYRINADQMSLDQLLQQVCNDFGLDYYAYINYDTYNSSTGVVSDIVIQSIDRVNATSNTEIQNFINNSVATGINISYQRGQELRSDPISCVVEGANYQYWHVPETANGKYIYPCWGRTNDGSVVWGNYQALYHGIADTPVTYTDGVVLLDHIVGSGSNRLNGYTIQNESITISYTSGAAVYPPQISRFTSTVEYNGYKPNQTVLQAALYSQDAWEALLYRNHYNFASGILHIQGQRFIDGETFRDLNLTPEEVRHVTSLSVQGSITLTRDDVTQNLINAVYEATKEAAENFYGKTFIVDLPTSQFLSLAQYGSEFFPKIEYEVASAAWSEYTVYPPTGVGNFFLLHDTHNANFKDEQGRIKPFVAIDKYNQSGYLGAPLDLKDMPRNEVLFEPLVNRMVMPISVEQYEKDPDKAIVTLPYVVKSVPLTNISGSLDMRTYKFYRFLKAMGYTDGDIIGYSLLSRAGDNQDYGLEMPRLDNVPTVAGTYGLHIPLTDNFATYGPYIASSGAPGGTKLIRDSSIAPWSFASYDVLRTAGNTTANRAISAVRYTDLAEVANAGLPEYNIGSTFGNNSIVNGLNIVVGREGLITNYSLRTFAIPPGSVTKAVQDKITSVYLNAANNRNIINLNDQINNHDKKQSIITSQKDFGPANSTDSSYSAPNDGYMHTSIS